MDGWEADAIRIPLNRPTVVFVVGCARFKFILPAFLDSFITSFVSLYSLLFDCVITYSVFRAHGVTERSGCTMCARQSHPRRPDGHMHQQARCA